MKFYKKKKQRAIGHLIFNAKIWQFAPSMLRTTNDEPVKPNGSYKHAVKNVIFFTCGSKRWKN
jgi:hypothetical protein